MEENYSKRELDMKFKSIHTKLDKILEQTTAHNQRLSRLEKIMIVVGTATIVLLITNGSKFIDFLTTII